MHSGLENQSISLGIDKSATSDAKEAAVMRFLNSGKEPITRLLPHLEHLNLNKSQVSRRIASARNFPFVMEKLKARRLQERLTSGNECRNLVDPSAKAWGVASPRFVRTHGPLMLSNLTYRCTRPSKFDSETDSFYVS